MRPRSVSRLTPVLSTVLLSASFLCLLLLAACSGNRKASTVPTVGLPIERGIASWYGPKFNGRRTASGLGTHLIGSTGGRQDPGRTFKNKKMPGQLGVDRVTTLNLKVVQTDVERGLILVEGAVPGAKGGWITVRDAVKKALPDGVPKPGAFKVAGGEGAAPAADAAPPADKEGA